MLRPHPLCSYIENLTWVWMHPNNSILREAYPYAKRSHLTLLIFRKEGKDTHTYCHPYFGEP